MRSLSSLFICILVVFFAAGIGCILFAESSVPAETYDEQTALAEILLSDIANHTSELSESLLLVAAYQGTISADDPAVSKSLSDLYVNNPSSTSIYRVNNDNVVVAAVPESAQSRIGYQITGFDLDPENMSASLYLEMYHRQSRDSTDLSLLVPVYSPAGEYEGYIAFVLNPDLFFGPALTKAALGRGEVIFLLNDDGEILYCQENTLIGNNAIQLADKSGFDTADILSRMVREKSGTATLPAYSYGFLKYVTLSAAWDTLETDYGNVTVVVSTVTNAQWTVDIPSATTNDTLESFVTSAYLYAVENGREKACAAFNDPNGPFVTQQYVIAAFDTNGTLLADALRPNLIGSDRSILTDSNGVQILQTLVQRASQGGGHAMYLHPNPMHDQRLEIKSSYIQPVNESWFVVAGKYLDEEPTYADPCLKNEIIQYARSVKQYALDNDRDAAVAEMNNPDGIFFRDDVLLMAVDADDIVIASPNNPTLIGTSITGITDIYGASIGRDILSSAHSGGGMQYQYLPNQFTHESEMTLIYTMPVDDTWFLAAGIPLTWEP
ncbi:MAG: cache domain-containing protein [Methanocorpusculum sp.]|nr:cache domain-containing protein [Methanocorpusculum sp.]